MQQTINKTELARMIDHTILKPEATPDEVRKICREALEYHFASVCVNPIYVPLVAQELRGSDVLICTVVGFPLGATSTAAKVSETELALAQGAQEVDMVLAVGMLKAGQNDAVKSDIAALAAVCHAHGAILKVILETALLTNEEKVRACELSKAAGADFVKTSTGFSKSGATAEDIALMRRTVGPELGVKASGGVRTYAQALAMIEAGASRIGASTSINIVEEATA
jgi:deoxyribose-phosphate aldolase